MKSSGIKQQTIMLTSVNAIVRMLGFVMRICTSRLLGAETLGIMELSQSIHMIMIAPFTSGLPSAICRLTAKAPEKDRDKALLAGLSLVRTVSFIAMPCVLIAAPWIGRMVSDVRIIPSLWFSAPCMMILGYSAAYNGYCYGISKPAVPAISELIEQFVRIILTVCLLVGLKKLTTPWLAAIPTAATMTAELIGLMFVLWCVDTKKKATSKHWQKSVVELAAPSTLTRIVQTIFRSVTSVIIPLRLQTGGLSVSEATTRLGQLNGVVSPVLMLPGIFTSALTMVTLPRMAQADEKPTEIKKLLLINLKYLMPLSVACSALVFFTSDFVASAVFHQPNIKNLLRLSTGQMLLFPVCHALSSTLTALGQQKSTLAISFISSIWMLILVWHLAAIPTFQINGVVIAQYACQMITIIGNLFCLYRWRNKQKGLIKSRDRFA